MKTNIRTTKKVAFLFKEGVSPSPSILGGKGAGLVELAALGAPVPPGFTVKTGVARAFSQHGVAPKRLAHQLVWGMKALEAETGKVFGSVDNPLLVSVRSGAEVSMPGMMDTVLNLGINPEIVEGLARKDGERFAFDCYRRFLSMFGEVVLGVDKDLFEVIMLEEKERAGVIFDRDMTGSVLRQLCLRYRELIVEVTGNPVCDDPHAQLDMALMAVLSSWNNKRAVDFRRAHKISHGLGTAVNVQAMVFGNRDDNSATLVAFSANANNGEPGIWGEFLLNAQGEDLVAGVRTPLPISQLSQVNHNAYEQLSALIAKLEARRNHVVEVECTIESGRLYVLQVRKAKLDPEAAATVACRYVWDDKLTKQEALAGVTAEQVAALKAPRFEKAALASAVAMRLLGKGLSASTGCAVGRVVTSSEAAACAAKRGEKVVLVRPDTSPDDLEGMLAACAIVTMTGGATSHAAVVARGLSKPCVVGVANLKVVEGMIISVDGEAGLVIHGEVKLAGAVNKKEVNLFLKWAAQEDARKWPKPRLDFELYNSSASANQMINDFYMVDAMANAAKQTCLEGECNVLRTRIHTQVAERLALYLVVAVGGEIRHAKDWWAEVDTLRRVFKTQLGGDRRAAQVATLNHLKTVSVQEQLRYLALVESVFNTSGWSGSVGGRKWGAIAKAALGFLKGELSHSVFADHAFDLQHNNGSVFGKNPMITGDRHTVGRQLEEKKYAAGVADLYQRLGRFSGYGGYGGYPSSYSSSHGRPTLDASVEALYRKGEQLGIWKPAKAKLA